MMECGKDGMLGIGVRKGSVFMFLDATAFLGNGTHSQAHSFNIPQFQYSAEELQDLGMTTQRGP
jgi:hypothetical protein